MNRGKTHGQGKVDTIVSKSPSHYTTKSSLDIGLSSRRKEPLVTTRTLISITKPLANRT